MKLNLYKPEKKKSWLEKLREKKDATKEEEPQPTQRAQDYFAKLDAQEEDYLSERRAPQKSRFAQWRENFSRAMQERKAAKQAGKEPRSQQGMKLNLLTESALVEHAIDAADEGELSDPSKFSVLLSKSKNLFSAAASKIKDARERSQTLKAIKDSHDDASTAQKKMHWITEQALRVGREELEKQYKMGMLDNVGFWKALFSIMNKNKKEREIFWRAFTPVALLDYRIKGHGKVIAQNTYVTSILERYKDELKNGRAPTVGAKDQKIFDQIAKAIRKNKAYGTLGAKIIESHIQKLEESNERHMQKVQELLVRKHDRVMFKTRRMSRK